MIQRDYLCKLLHDIDKISFVRILNTMLFEIGI